MRDDGMHPVTALVISAIVMVVWYAWAVSVYGDWTSMFSNCIRVK